MSYRTDKVLAPMSLVVAEDRRDDPDATILPKKFRDTILLDVIHDGDWLPAEFMKDDDGNPIPDKSFLDAYYYERDWGASLVAGEIASFLGLPGHYSVNVARVLMDFGRFPGPTPKDADHLHRFALNYPFSKLLSYHQKKRVLENYYDKISEIMENAISGKDIKIAIHTYDTHNKSGTIRPHLSLLTRSFGYQNENEMPYGVFDPLYPDVLAEFTCDRVLRDRISLTLEKIGLPVAHNYPYLLPDGSVEMRSQVWLFFLKLREEFETRHPETHEMIPYQMVWDMLLDTNLRSAKSEKLRSFFHFYRRIDDPLETRFNEAANAYIRIRDFLVKDIPHFVSRFRFSQTRTSALGIEIRKDLVWHFDRNGVPVGPRYDNIRSIGKNIAKAIHVYLTKDRDEVTRTDAPLTSAQEKEIFGSLL